MINEKEIRLLGQPIKIKIPGDGFVNLKTWKEYPTLKGGEKYPGYAMCDIHSLESSIHDIYIDIDNALYKICDWNVIYYPLNLHIEEVQDEVTFNKIRKIGLLLYNKFLQIEEELNNKVDKD